MFKSCTKVQNNQFRIPKDPRLNRHQIMALPRHRYTSELASKCVYITTLFSPCLTECPSLDKKKKQIKHHAQVEELTQPQ